VEGNMGDIAINVDPQKILKSKVRALYWNGTLLTFSLLFSVFISFIIYELFVSKGWNCNFLIIPAIPLIIFQITCFFRRANKLENEILAKLPEGWHLIFRFRGGAKGGMYVPDLVFEDEFQQIIKDYREETIFTKKKIKFTGKDKF
jgi:hypothetical protein